MTKKPKKPKKQNEIIVYLKESKNSIFLTLVVFLYLLLAGLLLPTPVFIAEKITELLNQLIEKTAGLTTLELIWFIFKNNTLVSLFGLILGVFLGIIPLLITALNGYVLGYVAKLLIKNNSTYHLWRLFPHGVFELPAIIISLGLGLKLGASLFTANPEREFLRRAVLSAKTFLFLILPLLAVAAIIEGILIKLFA